MEAQLVLYGFVFFIGLVVPASAILCCYIQSRDEEMDTSDTESSSDFESQANSSNKNSKDTKTEKSTKESIKADKENKDDIHKLNAILKDINNTNYSEKSVHVEKLGENQNGDEAIE